MNVSSLNPPAVSPAPTAAGHQVRNFLFLSAEACDEKCGPQCTHRKFMNVARSMVADGYVYVVHPGQTTAGDDEFGVRHLPLHETELPHFGNLTAAIVLNDTGLLFRVRHDYPDALVYLFENAAAFPVLAEAEEAAPALWEAAA